jgi:benzylsuccinate CoA-transferase BbsF subunit
MTTRLPLDGIRVADLTWMIAGPYGAYLLARMGADVIKIEGIDPLDHTRVTPPFADMVPGVNRSGFVNSLNAAKKSVTLQLRDPAQLDLAKEIIAKSDVFIESFSYGMIDKLGLGYEEARRLRPDIVMVSCSGFGQTGRDRALRAYMGTIHAYTGLNSINGYRGGPPKSAGGLWADYSSGAALVFAVMAALYHRKRSGCGQYIDLAMADVVVSMMGASFVDYFLNGRSGAPRGNDVPYASPNNVYPCRGDDAWVAISVETDAQWRSLRNEICDPALGTPAYGELARRIDHASAIDERIAAWTRQRTALEATEALQRAGVPAGPSSHPADLLEQPQLRARGFFIAPDHPEIGPRKIPNMPWKLSTCPDPPCPPAPLLGQHNDEVLGGLLGRPQNEIDALNTTRDAAAARAEAH